QTEILQIVFQKKMQRDM
ncbi:hypothetical protein ECPA38_0307, partial [Escherichia coli PA38]